MRVACLVSGGKDSLYACYVAQHYGWDVTSLITVCPQRLSWMYHRENTALAPLLAEAMNLPLLFVDSTAEKEKEVGDLRVPIAEADVDGVVAGTVASEYQRTRIERICHELGVRSFLPLWHKHQERLVRDMVAAGFEICVTAVAAEGLDESWLGALLTPDRTAHLVQLHERYGINVAGEGGEYETFVLDCPLYSKRVIIDEVETTWDGRRGTYEVVRAHLGAKR
jgi:ABC transporter with metal-binding/Fe-S-binding domain ATP-binding protein